MININLCLSLLVLLVSNPAMAKIIASYQVELDAVCTSQQSLLVLSGEDIPALLNVPLNHIALLNRQQKKIYSVLFQLDQKDEQGRYILAEINKNALPRTLISKQDEFVFRKKDLGQRIETGLEVLKPIELIEVQILQTSDESGRSGWIYIAIDPRNEKISFLSKEVSPVKSGQVLSNDIEYNQHTDTLTSLLYKMSFSQEKPFLLNAFHWRLSASEDQENLWSPDVTDTMKIRHLGRFLGFAFKRTDDDYDSQLIAVKEGPLRVIRRTENHVKVLWKLKSPALYIDYVMMPDGFVMNSMIDIPFNLSFFFSDLITLTTMDWDDSAKRPALKVLAEQANLILPVNGHDSADKIAFNGLPEQQFALSSDLGNFAVRLEIPDDFPIHSQLYLKDAQDEIDLPENIPGQFGNVGFKTTGWENIDTELHHLKFTVCVDKP